MGKASRISTLVTRMFQVKIGIRNIVMPGARRQTTVVIMLTAPRIVPRPATGETHDPQVGTGARGVQCVGERRVGEPAEVGGAAGGDEAGDGDDRAEQVQPVGERVEPRERDVGRTDLQRQDVVGEPEQDRRRVEQQHDRAVHGEQLVVLLVGEELLPGPGELGAHEQRHQAAYQEEHERRGQVHQTDRLGVGRVDQLADEGPTDLLPRWVGPRGDRLWR